MRAIGIDLGTTNTLGAYINSSNAPELIPDPRFSDIYITPSVVYVSGQTCVVGEALERILKANKNIDVVRHAKLLIGKNVDLLPEFPGRTWRPEAIAALVLRKVKQDAEVKLSTSVERALIAIPANFDSQQRLATKAAALMAGFQSIELVEEPIAAAASYIFNNNKTEQTIFVYDLGGGTFDATVIHGSQEGLYALSTLGSKKIGGKFFDDLVITDLIALNAKRSGSQKISVAARENFRRFAELAKATLHPISNSSIRHSLLVDADVMDVCYTYSHLSRLIYPLLDETIYLSDQCVADAGLDWSQIDTVLLVGGSSQLPAVREKVRALTAKTDDCIVLFQPHEAIAYGAAILAGNGDSGSEQKLKLKQQIASSHLGLRTLNTETGVSDVAILIKRNTPLPKTVKKTFYTNRRLQEKMVIELVQSKKGGEDIESLGGFSFGPFKNDKAHVPIEIEINYCLDGVVSLCALEVESGLTLTAVASQELFCESSIDDFVDQFRLV